MRRTNKIGQVKLILVQKNVSERLDQVGMQANVATQVKRYVLFETLTVKVVQHVLGVRVVDLRAFYFSELIDLGFCGGCLGL